MKTKSIWHTHICEIKNESIQQMLREIGTLREFPNEERATLFSIIQTFYNERLKRRLQVNETVPFGLLGRKIYHLECREFRAALAELGSWKHPHPLRLEPYAEKSVITFLNDYFCKQQKPKPFFMFAR